MALSRSPSPGALQDPVSDQQSIEAEEVELQPPFEASEPHSGRRSPNLDSENSPFISPEGSDFGENLIQNAAAYGVSEWHEDGQESKSVLYLILLTLSMGG